MPTYQRCPKEITDYARLLLEKFEDAHDKMYARILQARVKIDFLFAIDLEGAAIVHNGYPAIGLCSVTNIKQRALGLGDALITLDHTWWDSADDDARFSLLDHELFHITVQLEKDTTVVKRDDIGRPVLKLRKHDIQMGLFSTIAARHGSLGIERRQFAKVLDVYGQYLMPEIFGENPAPDLHAIVDRIRTANMLREPDYFATTTGA